MQKKARLLRGGENQNQGLCAVVTAAIALIAYDGQSGYRAAYCGEGTSRTNSK